MPLPAGPYVAAAPKALQDALRLNAARGMQYARGQHDGAAVAAQTVACYAPAGSPGLHRGIHAPRDVLVP
eukprot:7057492-Lingulodinium_polyedra.AAC.1